MVVLQPRSKQKSSNRNEKNNQSQPAEQENAQQKPRDEKISQWRRCERLLGGQLQFDAEQKKSPKQLQKKLRDSFHSDDRQAGLCQAEQEPG